MVTRTAGNDVNAFCLVQCLVCFIAESGVKNLAVCDSTLKRSRHGRGLFVNFLLHVMSIAAAFGRIGTQFTLSNGSFDNIAINVPYRNFFASNVRDIAFFKEDEVARNRQQCSNIGCNEVLFKAQTDNRRRALSREDQFTRVFGAHYRERVRALKLGDRSLDSLHEIVVCLHVEMNAMRDDFGIGL